MLQLLYFLLYLYLNATTSVFYWRFTFYLFHFQQWPYVSKFTYLITRSTLSICIFHLHSLTRPSLTLSLRTNNIFWQLWATLHNPKIIMVTLNKTNRRLHKVSNIFVHLIFTACIIALKVSSASRTLLE